MALFLSRSRATADNLERPLLVDLDDSTLPSAEDHLKDLCLGSSDHLRLERRDEELRLVGQVVDQRGNGCTILCVKSMVELVEDVEGSCVELEHCENESDNNDSLLAS